MGTVGWRKAVCKYGHVAPARYRNGACVPCRKMVGGARYLADRARYIRLAIARNEADPVARRDYGRATRLKVSVAEVRRAIEACAGRCEACLKPLTHAAMCIDHDHRTGVVRGVLCRFCNALEGMLTKQPERVEQLRVYLQRATAREIEWRTKEGT